MKKIISIISFITLISSLTFAGEMIEICNYAESKGLIYSIEFWIFMTFLFFIFSVFSVSLVIKNYRLKTNLNKKIEEVYNLVYQDFLTGLPNRRCLIEKLDKLSKESNKFAIIYIDLDRFKYINDTFGHSFGDRILILVSQRLRNILKDNEEIFRIGGDEFIIVVHNNSNEFVLDKRLKIILNSLDSIFTLDEIEFSILASAGISIFPKDSMDPNLLLTFADLAMYKAKLQGKNQFKFYKPEFSLENKELVFIEQELRYVLERNQLELYLQPQIKISKTGIREIIGAECLIRWIHPNHGIISPDKFIPIAEETGLIFNMGNFIVEEACKIQNKLNSENINIKLGINISAIQFKSKTFVKQLKKYIREYNVQSKNIELEITESLLMSTETELNDIFNELSMFGFKITIDDFGTGFSNFGYLKKFPINKVKIDKSFINDMLKENDIKILIKNIIRMTKDLHLDIIAEGVETPDQLNILQMLGCREIQGYYFSKPIPVNDFIHYYKNFETQIS